MDAHVTKAVHAGAVSLVGLGQADLAHGNATSGGSEEQRARLTSDIRRQVVRGISYVLYS